MDVEGLGWNRGTFRGGFTPRSASDKGGNTSDYAGEVVVEEAVDERAEKRVCGSLASRSR